MVTTKDRVCKAHLGSAFPSLDHKLSFLNLIVFAVKQRRQRVMELTFQKCVQEGNVLAFGAALNVLLLASQSGPLTQLDSEDISFCLPL